MRPIVAALLLLAGCQGTADPPPPASSTPFSPVWATPKLLVGAEPPAPEGFDHLARLGVKTVISVDGAKPDVEAAKASGMRYVHLPIGYDGVPEERARELAKAILELEGPIYLHCHRGKHRGPAAAAVACVVAGTLDTESALRFMRMLGTGPEYVGLWDSARRAKQADPGVLRELRANFRETAPIPPLAEAMVGLDGACEHLELGAKAGWKVPAGHQDLDLSHEALRTREILTEILRTEDLKGRPEDFQTKMKACLDAAQRLEGALRAGEPGDAAFGALKRTCADCHKPYRNSRRR